MNIQDYVKTNEKGEVVLDQDKFKSDLDRERNNASQTSKANTEKSMRTSIEKEVRAMIEEEAKLSMEEKLAKEREAIAQERQELNREKIKSMYTNCGLFSDTEVEHLMGFVSVDFEKSSKCANELIKARTERFDSFKKELSSQIQSGQPSPSGTTNDKVSEVVKIAQSINSRREKQKEIEF